MPLSRDTFLIKLQLYFCFASDSQLFKQVPDLHLTSQLPWCVERATERRTLASQGGVGAAYTAREAGSATAILRYIE